MNNINFLFEVFEELQQEEEGYIKDLRISDVICKLEVLLGA